MLHNTLPKEILAERLENESFKRTTLSFYRYVTIVDPSVFRNYLFLCLSNFQCLGRIYVANEGINAQMNIPEHHLNDFLDFLQQMPETRDMPIKYAVEDDGKSFLKLIIKIKHKIVADGLPDHTFDTTNVGRHLSASEFNEALQRPETIVVDVRNNYESEVGHFKDAICPDAVTFREELELLPQLLDGKKEHKILLYCTGGIRCEKASAYLKHLGYNDVNQLHGGIIDYVRQVKSYNLEGLFYGKNFVFDQRMSEKVTDDVLAHCHQCDVACDTHVNCANDACHMLFIQCNACAEKYKGCCSPECTENKDVPVINFQGKNWRRGKRSVKLSS